MLPESIAVRRRGSDRVSTGACALARLDNPYHTGLRSRNHIHIRPIVILETPDHEIVRMDGIGLAMNSITLVQILQQIYETLKDAPTALEKVIAQANSLAALIKRLDSIEPFLSEDRKQFLASQFDRAACASTVRDLRTL